MKKKRKGKYAPKITAEEYKKLTGQGLGSLYNGHIGNVTNVPRS